MYWHVLRRVQQAYLKVPIIAPEKKIIIRKHFVYSSNGLSYSSFLDFVIFTIIISDICLDFSETYIAGLSITAKKADTHT